MKKLILLVCLIIGNIAFAADVKILHTSDVHGRIAPITYKDIPNQGGLARRVQFINDYKYIFNYKKKYLIKNEYYIIIIR